jgi:hypothetical protein
MELRFKNKTESPQQIFFCDGTALSVLSGDEKIIDVGSVFTEEIKRASKFFSIEEVTKVSEAKEKEYEVPVVKDKYSKNFKKETDEENNDGGTV